MDAWGVGCFIQEIFSGRKLTRTEELRELSRIPQVRSCPRLLPAKRAFSCGVVQALQKHYQRLLGSVPARRLNPAALLESTVFANKLVRFGPSARMRTSAHYLTLRRWTPSLFSRS